MVKEKKKSNVYGEIHKSHISKIIIQKSKYKNKDYLDLRLWISQNTKDWIATKSGVNMPWESVAEFKEIVKKIKE